MEGNQGAGAPARKCPCRMTEEELFAAHGVPYEPLRNGFHLPRVGDADELRQRIIQTLGVQPDHPAAEPESESEPEPVGEIVQRVRATVAVTALRRVG